jgi:hypothetical protein
MRVSLFPLEVVGRSTASLGGFAGSRAPGVFPRPVAFPRVASVSWWCCVLPVISACCLSTGTVAAQRHARTRVPDEPTCARCVIAIGSATTLQASEDGGTILQPPSAVRRDGSGRYWVLAGGGPPIVYDSGGSFVGLAGRAGGGPGEFMFPGDVVPIAGDSVLVIDVAQRRATVLGGDLRPGRLIRMPWALQRAVVVNWPALVVMNGDVSTPAGAGWSLHRVSFAQEEVSVLGSFGPDQGEMRPGSEFAGYQHLASVRGDHVWSADRSSYRLHLWTPDGVSMRSLERTPEWFSTTSPMGIGSPATPPPPAVTAIEEDAAGLVWVFIRVPAESWQEAWSGVPLTAREVSVRDIAFEKLFRTVIEVIDPRRARVVARRFVDKWVVASIPGLRAAMYATNADGVPTVSIVQLLLANP